MTTSLQPLVVAFPDRLDGPVLDGFGLIAQPGRRIGLVGENGVGKAAGGPPRCLRRPAGPGDRRNGTGKSTLLGVLSGRITPTSGAVQVTPRRVAELVQDVVFPEPRLRAEATYSVALGEERARLVPLLELGLFHRRDLRTSVGRLSIGQRRRLGLALAVASGPDLLLLDEPTNHLSLSLAGELEEALGTTPGTVIVASHDRWLRRRWEGDEVSLGS